MLDNIDWTGHGQIIMLFYVWYVRQFALFYICYTLSWPDWSKIKYK